jgi:fatty acid desaturase
MFADLLFMTSRVAAYLPLRFVFVFKHLLPKGEYIRLFATVAGFYSGFFFTKCCWALPLSGWTGLKCFLFMVPLKEYLGIYPYHAFFSQHVWDKEISEKEANKDWGRHNAETSYSWWPSWPVAFSCTRFFGDLLEGHSPATLTYHLEHTMFPGINYLYPPRFAPIRRSTCAEFGITYNGLYSFKEVDATRQGLLVKYKHDISKTLRQE